MSLFQAYLRELFDYREDGELIRRINRGRARAGSLAGGKPDKRGYRRVTIDGDDPYLHQVIFAWHHGYWPEMVDHDDRDKSNNRIGNLLASDAFSNGNNRSHTVKSQTLVKGVFVRGQRFVAQRTVRGKAHYLGLHDTVEQAEQALVEFDRK